MGTKLNPGPYDCYKAAMQNEPIFVLRGEDPAASLVVTFWRKLRQMRREKAGQDPFDAKDAEARACSLHMETWAREHGGTEELESTLRDFASLFVATPPTK